MQDDNRFKCHNEWNIIINVTVHWNIHKNFRKRWDLGGRGHMPCWSNIRRNYLELGKSWAKLCLLFGSCHRHRAVLWYPTVSRLSGDPRAKVASGLLVFLFFWTQLGYQLHYVYIKKCFIQLLIMSSSEANVIYWLKQKCVVKMEFPCSLRWQLLVLTVGDSPRPQKTVEIDVSGKYLSG